MKKAVYAVLIFLFTLGATSSVWAGGLTAARQARLLSGAVIVSASPEEIAKLRVFLINILGSHPTDGVSDYFIERHFFVPLLGYIAQGHLDAETLSLALRQADEHLQKAFDQLFKIDTGEPPSAEETLRYEESRVTAEIAVYESLQLLLWRFIDEIFSREERALAGNSFGQEIRRKLAVLHTRKGELETINAQPPRTPSRTLDHPLFQPRRSPFFPR